MVTCPNKSAISLPVLKGEKFHFSLTIFGLLLCFSIVFCHFPVIVQILSFEQKLLLGIEYPFKRFLKKLLVPWNTKASKKRNGVIMLPW